MRFPSFHTLIEQVIFRNIDRILKNYFRCAETDQVCFLSNLRVNKVASEMASESRFTEAKTSLTGRIRDSSKIAKASITTDFFGNFSFCFGWRNQFSLSPVISTINEESALIQ